MGTFVKKKGVVIGTCLLLVLLYVLNRVNRHGTETLSSESTNTGSTGALVNVIEEHHEEHTEDWSETLFSYHFIDITSQPPVKFQFHIDGHIDGADPYNRLRNPIYRMPRNESEIRLMMERNDVCVQAAAGTGLINRFIWVWPPYSEEDEPYVSFQLEAGLMYTEENELVPCCCMKSDYINFEHSCIWMQRAEHEGEDEKHFKIERGSCLDMTLGGTVEIVSTEKAIELAKSGNWIKASDSVILDIDEDFYACEAVSAPLDE